MPQRECHRMCHAWTAGWGPGPNAVTTATHQINSRVLAIKPRTHLRTKRANILGKVPPITAPTNPNRKLSRLNPELMEMQEATRPNCDRIQTYHPKITSEEAVNFISDNTYYNVDMRHWTLGIFLEADISSLHGTANHDLAIKRFYAPVFFAVTGETISS